MTEKEAVVSLIDGKKYYDISTFCALTNKTFSNIKSLITKGNKVRKLKSIRHLNKTFIDINELREYPYATSGHGTWHKIYYLNSKLEYAFKEYWNSETKTFVSKNAYKV
jgi:hypothetical protein